jgi:parallel beta-helix repeat protein
VRNCYIHDNGSSAWPCDAIFTSDVDDVLVGNILVNNNDTGIAIDSGSRITAVGNYLEGNARGVYAKASAAHCGHIVIVGNVFLNNNINILLERTASYELNEVTVVGNKIVGGTYGVEVNALRVIVSNNADSDHGAGGVGIRLTGGNEIQVLGNIFTNSGKGIELAGADAVWIKHNRFIAVTTPIAFTVSPGTFMIRDNVGYDTGNFKATGVGVAVGTGGAYGSAVAITSPSGRITYPRIKITWGGTFGTGETVTVRVEAVYSDGSTAYVERSATAVGSAWLTDDDVLALIAKGKDIIKLNVYAKSNMSTTSVTVTVDAYGKA